MKNRIVVLLVSLFVTAIGVVAVSAPASAVTKLSQSSAASQFSGAGGTEVGHASGTYSHYNGYKIDITHGTCVDGYIHNSFTRIANRGDGAAQWKAGSGNIYADEGSHWDITYYTCGC